MINVGNIQVREGASIPKAQHGTMTKGLAPAEYNIGIDPLVGPWESLSDLEAYMISSGRKDKQGNPLFINGQETTVVGSDGIPHKYIRSNGAWLAMNYSGGGSAQMPTAQDQLDFINTYYKVVLPVTVSYEWVPITNGPSRVYIKTDIPVKYSEAPFKIKIYGESNGDIDTSTTVDLYTGEHSRTFSSYGTLDQDIQGFDVNVATDTFPLPLDQSNYSTPNVAITFVELDSENDDYECVDGLQDPSNNAPLISMEKIVDNLTN